ncbi:HEAT repeat domain-containing protein [Dendronalium sp. ChiSLP03b]|uniref:HEAT repeat domain-containing protein n=1 Tax=Dendronalium sp. ChiSLP03b TaxID=3075381 RepID=UPI002AD3A30D|nr:HEAT repeat domain-containing protein [Dendronalium sp. ChiSLP03b]MDZ8208481.1 HEAT repeat domain-containing protein [Dendronalium sp. ChiSLP03b]
MDDWQYFFNSDRSNLNQGTYRIFEPEWKANILHWFSREDVAKEQKEGFIEALIDFDGGCGDFYRYRAYFLAAEAIAKFPECSLGDAIVEQLLKWSYGYFRQDKQDWQILPQPLVKAARKTLELTDRKRVVAAFVYLVHTTESRLILKLAAEKLGKLDPGNQSAIAALALMPVVENEYPCCQTNQNPGEILVGDETAIASLIPIIETTLSKEICYLALLDLGKIAIGNQTAIASLSKFLQTNQGDRICYDAACALWKIDPGNQAVLKALVNIIATSASAYLIDSVAENLLTIAPGNQDAIASLLEIIDNTENEFLRLPAAFYLGKFEPGNTVAIRTLSHLLQTTEDESVRLDAADSLATIDPGNPKAIATLCQILESEPYKNESILMDAVHNLEQLHIYDKLVQEKLNEVIPTLIQFIQTFTQDDDKKNCFNNQATTQLSYGACLIKVADSLTKILPSEQLPQTLISLKDNLSEQFYKNSSYRYEAVFNIIWHCAENMNYPDFYKLWHS